MVEVTGTHNTNPSTPQTQPKEGSHSYPSNYVSRALIEQIAEARVQVIDSKDGLSTPSVQITGVGTRDSSTFTRNPFVSLS